MEPAGFLVGIEIQALYHITLSDCCCTCQPGALGPEICGDGIDNDGDNQIDEGCDFKLRVDDNLCKDDTIGVRMDDQDLGQTPLGKERFFDISRFSSGEHTLDIIAVASGGAAFGCSDDQIVSYGVQLSGGVEFVRKEGAPFTGTSDRGEITVGTRVRYTIRTSGGSPVPTITGLQVSSLAQMAKPGGIVVDASGNAFVIGRDSGTLSKISPSGAASVIAQLGADVGGWFGPALDKAGNLYVSHFTADQVLKVTQAGAVSTLTSGISQPTGLTVDANGNLYVASFNTGKVFKITPGGAPGLAALDPGTRAALHSASKLAAPTVTEYAAGLSQPEALTFNAKGELLIANRGNNQISKVPAGGGAASLFAQLQQAPQSLAVDASGDLIVGTAGGSLLKVKADGTQSTVGSGFSSSSGLAVDPRGALYIADAGQGTVFKAVGAATEGPDIDVSPTALDFSNVPAGQTRDLPLTVRNLGNAELRIQSIGVNSPFALVSPSAPLTVAVGATQTLTFRFAPTSARNETATAVISSNDRDEGSVSVSLSGIGSSSVPTTRQARASLHCLSLRFQRMIGTGPFGESFELELTSLSPDDPANGELYPAAFPPSYASTFILKGAALVNSLTGDLFVEVPETGDSNGNDLDDFFEVNRGVNAVTTVGDYTSDFDGGTIKATWSRAAGSKTGTCHLELKGDVSGLEADFTATFELLEFSGPLTYTVSTDAVSANVRLGQVPSGADTLAGPLRLTRVSATEMNRVNIAAGEWANGAGKKLEFNASALERSASAPSSFSGDLLFQDGDPDTAAQDYFEWVLVVTDPNDSDGDGIPDLSDPSSVGPPPTLRFVGIRFDNTALVITWQGTGRLQSAPALTGPWGDQPFRESPARITPTERLQFFRLVQQ